MWGTFNKFFVRSLFGSWIMLFKTFSVQEIQHLPKGQPIYSLIPPFTDFFNQSVNSGICLFCGPLYTFFIRNFFGSWIVLFKRY